MTFKVATVTKYFSLRKLPFAISKIRKTHFLLVAVNTHSLTCNLLCYPEASFANPAFQNLEKLLLAWPCSKTKSWNYPSMQGKSVCWGTKGRCPTKKMIQTLGWAPVGWRLQIVSVALWYCFYIPESGTDALFCESRKIPTATAEIQVSLMNIYLNLQKAQIRLPPGGSNGVSDVQHCQDSGLDSRDLAGPWLPCMGLPKVPGAPVLALIFMNAWPQPKLLETLSPVFSSSGSPSINWDNHRGWYCECAVKLMKLIL